MRTTSEPAEPESAIMHAIMQRLGAHPSVIVYRNSLGVHSELNADGSPRTRAFGCGGPGAPDLLCEVRGADGEWRAVWLECKRPGAKLSPVQQRWHTAAHARGRHCFVVHSVDEAFAAVRSVLPGTGNLQA